MMKTALKLLILSLLITINNSAIAMDSKENNKIATFAGGCFWCTEAVFDEVDGVISAISGYSGGSEKDANYEDVSSKRTEHIEVVQVEYDPRKITFKELLEIHIKNIDPLDPAGQFADKGPQYLTSVYYNNEEEKEITEKYFQEVKDKMLLKGDIQTKIEPYKNFFPAEEYHQDYYKKNPLRYNSYKYGSGRPQRLKEVWGKD